MTKGKHVARRSTGVAAAECALPPAAPDVLDELRVSGNSHLLDVKPVSGAFGRSLISFAFGCAAKVVEDPDHELSWCMTCLDGGDMAFCDSCELPFCIECVRYDPELMYSDSINARCLDCHYMKHKGARPSQPYTPYVDPKNTPVYPPGNSFSTNVVMANPLSRFRGSRDGNGELNFILIVNLRLQNFPMTSNGAGVLATHLSGYYATSACKVITVDIPFDLMNEPMSYELNIERLLKKVVDKRFIYTSFWFLNNHTTPDQPLMWTTHGDTEQRGAFAAPLATVFERLFPPNLVNWLERPEGRNVLIAQTCGGPLKFQAGRDAWWDLSRCHGFTATIAFEANNFMPQYSHFFSQNLGEMYGVMQQPLESAIQDSLSIASRCLGPHTNVHIFTYTHYKVWYWAQIDVKPYGVDRLIMCPQCHNLCELTLEKETRQKDSDKSQRSSRFGMRVTGGGKAPRKLNFVKSVKFRCKAITGYDTGNCPICCDHTIRYRIPNYKWLSESSFACQVEKTGVWVSFNGEALVGDV